MGEARLIRVRRLAAVLVVVLAVVACSPTEGTSRGVVVEVEGTLTEVTAFTVLLEGEEIRFLPVEDGDYAFPLGHLRDHLRSGEPVLIGWEKVDGVYYALSLDDG